MKVGEYVRFKTLSKEIKIGKVIEIIEPDKESMKKYCVYDLDNNEATVDDYIIKSSPNIIDLIEVGDILSFKDKSICRVLEITDNGYYLLKDFGGEQYYESKEYINELKSIVTHEMFENMEYKIGSE